MRLTNIHRLGATLILGGAIASADSVNLRSGEVVQGTYIGGNARQIRVDVNGDIRTYDLQQVQSVTFTDANYQPPAPAQRDNYPPPPPPQAAAPQAPPQAAAPQGAGATSDITLPAY